MKFKSFPILAGAALAAAVGAQTTPGAQAAEGVTLHRGATSVTTESVAGGIAVVRGPAVETRPYTAPESAPIRLATGERIWFIDENTGRLSACTLRFTSTVGREAIRCSSRRLPHGIRAGALERAD